MNYLICTMIGKSDSEYLLGGLIILLFPILTNYYIDTTLAVTSPDCQRGSSQPIIKAGIDVNNFPIGIAVNSFTNMIYITNAASNTVSVINGETDSIEHTIPVGVLPYDVDVDPYTNKIYVANRYSNNLSVIDGDTNTIIKTINVSTPTGIDIDSDKSWIYVTNIDNNSVSKIDAITNTVVKYAKVGKNPYTVDIKSGRDAKIYVTNLGSNSVSVLDKDSFETLKNITVGESPVGLAANPYTNTVYVANRGADSVAVINATSNTLMKTLDVGNNPDGIDINFKMNRIYVTNTGSSTVCVIDGDTNEVIKSIPINNNMNPELSMAVVKDLQLLPPSLKFPNVATFVDNNQDTNMTYVTNTGSSTVSVIDSNANNLLVGLTVKNNPPNQGEITCADAKNRNDNHTFSKSSQYIRVTYGTEFECTASPKIGYSFDFWDTNPPEKVTEKETDLMSSIILYFKESFSPEPSPIQKINATQYNKELIANYKAGQNFIPLLLIPIIFTVFIPFIIKGGKWLYKKLNNRVFGLYLRRHNRLIDDAYEASAINIKEADERLSLLRTHLIDDLHKGSSDENEYRALETKLSTYYNEISLKQKYTGRVIQLRWKSSYPWKNMFKIKNWKRFSSWRNMFKIKRDFTFVWKYKI